MPIKMSDRQFKHIENVITAEDDPQPQTVLQEGDCKLTKEEISRWPGYEQTPLLNLAGLAKKAGIAKLWYKDEAPRFGLKSFKALGGAYAVSQILKKEIKNQKAIEASTDDLISGRYSDISQQLTVSCATDGNHGRSVAWGAQKFGCNCVIYIHATVSEGRKRAIEHYGAKVVRTDSNYDDSVRQAASDAQQFDRVVVSDTSYPGYMDIPKYVMQGYTVITDEIFKQLELGQFPTHIFLQGGVGGFAGAIIARIRQFRDAPRPRIIIVEPDSAACIYASIKRGEPVALEGDLETIMAGLACGEVSLLAWEILKFGVDDAMVVSDESAAKCMRILAEGQGPDRPVVAGESAVAGLAGMLCALENKAISQKLGLDASSKVLVIGTEGATDEGVYQKIVGRSSEQVSQT